MFNSINFQLFAFFAKSIGEIAPFDIEPFIDHCAKEILYFLALILFNLSTSNEAKPNNDDDNKPEKISSIQNKYFKHY